MTYLPRTHHGLHIPQALLHALLIVGLIVLLPIAAWALLESGTSRTDDSYLTSGAVPVDPAAMRTIAYLVPGQFSDEIRLQPIDGGSPRVVARIPHFLASDNTGARGVAAPTGDVVAVLAVPPDGGQAGDVTYADLNLVALPGGAVSKAGRFDPLSAIAWAADGSRLAVVRSGPIDESGRKTSRVVEVDAAGGIEALAAEFPPRFDVAPVGYSADGARLFIVVIDAAGSELWVAQGGELTEVGQLSPGRTRDWSLSPDGSRLAYVDVLSTDERAYAGRTFLIAAGQVVKSELPGNQLGSTWRPGHGVADFGSPAGAFWQLEPAPDTPVYVVPVAWSPDGTTLVASIHPIVDGRALPEGSLEVTSAETRVPLEDGARLLGFVLDE